MIRFFKNRIAHKSEPNQQLSLGRLELALMQILWSHGKGNVREVVQRLQRPLAYTTVMTTLDRLYKKGFLDREMLDRAFVYSAHLSRGEWERQRAENIFASLFSDSNASLDLLVSSFLDAAGRHDASVLDELERKIRTKRKELCRREPS
ncbi:MAG TPA: BlaI/MecI/CopY family transcriptional regulator [Candidatus Acidoferrum sp.]|nr:BlaI/MecI/CopY family transcriptional regulator [Candidatus Acidoferrum sp.]